MYRNSFRHSTDTKAAARPPHSTRIPGGLTPIDPRQRRRTLLVDRSPGPRSPEDLVDTPRFAVTRARFTDHPEATGRTRDRRPLTTRIGPPECVPLARQSRECDSPRRPAPTSRPRQEKTVGEARAHAKSVPTATVGGLPTASVARPRCRRDDRCYLPHRYHSTFSTGTSDTCHGTLAARYGRGATWSVTSVDPVVDECRPGRSQMASR